MLLSYLLHNLMFSALQIMMKQIKNKDNVVTKKPPPSIPVDIEEKHHRKQFIEFHNITDNACANRMMAIHAHKEGENKHLARKRMYDRRHWRYSLGDFNASKEAS